MAAAGLRIGLSWGTTLFQVVRHLRPLDLRGVEVVQLHGGLGAEDPAIDAFGLAQGLAEKLHGRYRVIQAPISVASRELREQLVREPGIAETLKSGARAGSGPVRCRYQPPALQLPGADRFPERGRVQGASGRWGRGHGVRPAHRRPGRAVPLPLERAVGRHRGGGAPAHPPARRQWPPASRRRRPSGRPCWRADRHPGDRRRAGPGAAVSGSRYIENLPVKTIKIFVDIWILLCHNLPRMPLLFKMIGHRCLISKLRPSEAP